MNGPFGRLARFWRRVHLGRNPLARRSDRVEAAILIVVVLGLLIAMPLAAIVGSNTYRGQLALSTEQNSSRHLATATLIEDAPTPVVATDGAFVSNGSTGVHARWTVSEGVERVGTVAADPGSTAGTKVPIWLTASGDPVPAPMSASDVTTTSVLAGIFTWMLAALVLAAMFWIARFVLDRRRAAGWEREWADVRNRWARY